MSSAAVVEVRQRTQRKKTSYQANQRTHRAWRGLTVVEIVLPVVYGVVWWCGCTCVRRREHGTWDEIKWLFF
jgi:hypothetical protein